MEFYFNSKDESLENITGISLQKFIEFCVSTTPIKVNYIQDLDYLHENETLVAILFYCTIVYKIKVIGLDFVNRENLFYTTGPMCAGKSLKLLNDWTRSVKGKRYPIRRNVKFFSGGQQVIRSRDRRSGVPCKFIKNFAELLNYKRKILIIDECHFIDFDLELIEKILANGNQLHFFGLVFNFKQQVFSTLNLWWILQNCVTRWISGSICSSPNCHLEKPHAGFFSKRHDCEGGEFVANKSIYYVSCTI